MKTIYKYPLENTSGKYAISMPSEAEILYINAQRNVPCIWAMVDTEKPIETRQFRLYGTGHPVEENDLFHHGSFFMQEGRFVFHLFEVQVWHDNNL